MRLAMATIRDAGTTGDFPHRPLRDPENEIRLVQVDRSRGEDSEIQGTTNAHSILDSPPYVAISYTWGDLSEKAEFLSQWRTTFHRSQQLDSTLASQATSHHESLLGGHLYSTKLIVMKERMKVHRPSMF
jgi:hypothetical protein